MYFFSSGLFTFCKNENTFVSYWFKKLTIKTPTRAAFMN